MFIFLAVILYFLPFTLLFTNGYIEQFWAFSLLILLWQCSIHTASCSPLLSLVSLSSFLFILNGRIGAILLKLPTSFRVYTSLNSIIINSQNFTGNFFLQILNPILFSVVACAYFETMASATLYELFWIIVPIYWSMHLLFIFIKNYWQILNLRYECIACFGAILLSWFIFHYLIQPLIYSSNTVFISQEALRDALWYGVIAYIFAFICKIYPYYFPAIKIIPRSKQKAYIQTRKRYLSEKHDRTIQTVLNQKYPSNMVGRKEFVNLLYAIMIYEDFNRPKYLRKLESFLVQLSFCKRKYSLGIMQVTSSQPLNDQESIESAVDILLPPYLSKLKFKSPNIISYYSTCFNSSHFSSKIYMKLCSSTKKASSKSYSRRMIPSSRTLHSPKYRIKRRMVPLTNSYLIQAVHAALIQYNGDAYAKEVSLIYSELNTTIDSQTQN